MTRREAIDNLLIALRDSENYESSLLECDADRDDIVAIERDIEALNMAIRALSEELWISVDEMPPPKSGTYLIITRRGAVTTTHYYSDSQRFSGVGRHARYWRYMPAGV